MKVVFLDFDGVLNSHRFMLEERAQGGKSAIKGVAGLDPKAITHVNYICGKTGAVVVVSSSWRYGHNLGELKDILLKAGCTAVVRDATPLPHEFVEFGPGPTERERRGHEITNGKLATAFAEHKVEDLGQGPAEGTRRGQGMDLTEEEAKRTLIIAKGRGHEIDAWLRAWSEVDDIESFVVLDDDSDITPHEDRHVKTSFHEGLTSEHVPLALEILGRPWKAA